MGRKKKKKSTGDKASAKSKNMGDFSRREVLQAVLLADSFNRRFQPITYQKAKVRYFVCVCVYVCIYVCVYIYICMCV